MRKDYSPEEALTTLLDHLDEVDPVLADRVRQAIDAGIEDEQEQEIMSAGKKSKRVKRTYRKARGMTAAEALREAGKVFNAYFLERRLIVNSALEQFSNSTVGERSSVSAWSKEQSKVQSVSTGVRVPLMIELQRESEYIRENGVDLLELVRTEDEELFDIREELSTLGSLLDFEDEE